MKLNKFTLRQILLIIAFTILLYWGLAHPETVGALFSAVGKLFSPFLIGLAVAFVLNLPLRMFERLWDRLWAKQKGSWPQKLKRPVCLVLSFILVLGIFTGLFFMLIPELSRTVESIISMVPDFVDQVIGWWQDLSAFALDFGIELPDITADPAKIVESVTGVLAESEGMLNKTVTFTTGLFTGIFSAVFNLVLSVVFSIYILAQKELLGKQGRRALVALFPAEKVDHMLELLALSNRTFSSFLTGQAAEAVIIGVLCAIGMLIFGMPYVLPISVLVGFTALIPVFGAFIGTGIGALLILMVSPIKAIWFVVFIIVLQQLEGNLIYPRVVGKSVGLPGIWVLAAVTLGGNAFGVVGMLLGVPLCAVLYTLARRSIDARLEKKGLLEEHPDPEKE